MRKFLVLASAAAAATFLSTSPAQAATVLNATCSGNCFTGLDIVNLTSSPSTSLGVGTVSGATINFTSSTDLLELENGAATISAADDSGFGQLTFKLLGGYGFTQADFSLLQATNPLNLTFTLSDGTIQNVSIPVTTGSEPFGIQADPGTLITQVAFNTTAGSFTTFKQLKLGGVSRPGGVPEPSTWAMMLFGFGAVGFGLRRKDRKSATRIRFAM